MKIKTMLMISTVLLLFSSCQESLGQQDNDVTGFNLPVGTTQLIQKAMKYNYLTDELVTTKTETFNFNKFGNYTSHVTSAAGRNKKTVHYSYDEENRLSSTVETVANQDKKVITRYTYSGENPLIIKKTVENGSNYVPKVLQYFNNGKKVKEEVFNNAGTLRNREEYDGNKIIITSFDNSGNPSYRKEKLLKNGHEIKRINYNLEGVMSSGIEKELDDYGNLTQSWVLDANGERSIKSFGYDYHYDNKLWDIRISNKIKDYGKGKIANVKTRTIEGVMTTDVTDAQIKSFLKQDKGE